MTIRNGGSPNLRAGKPMMRLNQAQTTQAKPKVNPADFENYRGGDAPDRTPGRFSPIDNERYGRSSYEKVDSPDRSPGRFSPVDNEGYGRSSYEKGDGPDRTPGRFSPVDNEGYGRSSYEKGQDSGSTYQTREGGVLAPPTGGGDPNQSLQKEAQAILLGQVGGQALAAERIVQKRARLAEKVQRLAERGFQPDPNTRFVVGAALGVDAFAGR